MLRAVSTIAIAAIISGCAVSQGLTPTNSSVRLSQGRAQIPRSHTTAHLATSTGGVWVAYQASGQSGDTKNALFYLKYPYTKVTTEVTSGVGSPGPIAASAAKGVVAEDDQQSGTVRVYSTVGKLIAVVKLAGVVPGALAFDSIGDLLIANLLSGGDSGGDIFEASYPYSKFQKIRGVPGSSCNGYYCLTTDSHNNVLLADYNNMAVHVWLRSGSSYSAKPFDINQPNNQQPIALTIDAKDNVFVGEYGGSTVNEYSATSSTSKPYSTKPKVFSLSTLPTGYASGDGQLAVDAKEDLLALEDGGNVIAEFPDLAGNAKPIAAGLESTVAMAIDAPGGNLLVADQADGAIIDAYAPPFSRVVKAIYLGRGSGISMAYAR